MPLFHLVPVGLSLLEGREFPESAIKVRDAMPWAASAGKLDWDLLSTAGVSRLTAADPSMAAEWTSVAAIQSKSAAATAGDAFVLIATDTDDGLRAAAMIAAFHDQSGVHYLHEPLKAGRPAVEPGDVYICRIPELDLGERQPKDVTWRSLGAVGRMAADAATQHDVGQWQVIVHLSGGYKAMIPYLMMMAEGVNSLLRDTPPGEPRRRPVRAVAVHESSLAPEAAATPILIDVPVRAIGADLLLHTRELAKVAQPDRDVISDDVSDLLTGLFVDAGRLTKAGLIMVSML